jgi:hypothetical protein
MKTTKKKTRQHRCTVYSTNPGEVDDSLSVSRPPEPGPSTTANVESVETSETVSSVRDHVIDAEMTDRKDEEDEEAEVATSPGGITGAFRQSSKATSRLNPGGGSLWRFRGWDHRQAPCHCTTGEAV